MWIRPPDQDQLIKGLTRRGVPPYLFRHKGVEIDKALKPIPIKQGQVTIAKQLQGLIDILKAPIGYPYLLAISGNDVSDNAALVALGVMTHAIKLHNLPQNRQPWWHRTLGTGKDILLDDEKPSNFGRPAMLILDGIIEESNTLKIERTRDLIQLYSHLPRIVLLAGSHPIAFMQQRLRVPATRYLYLSDRNLIVSI